MDAGFRIHSRRTSDGRKCECQTCQHQRETAAKRRAAIASAMRRGANLYQ